MNSRQPVSTLQPIDLNARTNRRYTILGSGASTTSTKDRFSIGPNQNDKRRASVVPKAQATPKRVSMMPSTAKSPGRNNTNKPINSRLSMIGPGSTVRPTPGGTLGNAQDPRPLKNKQYMAQTILRLVDFMEAHDYPNKQLGPENLQTPSTKDFQQIFEFLMQCIDRDFKLTNDSLDQIPALLKALGYPFGVSKSSLMSAGAPHTWPVLLGALSWLRELIEFEEIANSGEDQFSKHIPNKMFFDFLTKAYALFLQVEPDEDIAALEDELSEVVREQREGFEQQLAQKREHKQNLIAEIERLKKSEKRPEALKQSRAILLKDIEKYENYLKECQKIMMILDQQHELLLSEHESRKRDLESSIQQLNQYSAQLATQELKQTDVERIKLESAQISENLKQVNNKRLAAEKRAWHKNLEILQVWDRCEKLVQEYTELCTTLQLIPKTSEDDIDFAISIGTLHDPHVTADMNFLRQQLQPLMEDYRVADKETFDEGLAIKNSFIQLQEKQTELTHIVKELECEQERLSNLRNTSKAKLEHELTSYYEQIETMQNEKENFEADTVRLKNMSTQNLQKEQLEFEQQKIFLEARHNEFGQNFLNTLDMVVAMKARIQQQLEDFKQQLTVIFDNIVIQPDSL